MFSLHKSLLENNGKSNIGRPCMVRVKLPENTEKIGPNRSESVQYPSGKASNAIPMLVSCLVNRGVQTVNF